MKYKFIPKVCSVLVILIGVTMCCLWLFFPSAKGFSASVIKFNTAVGMICLGASLLLRAIGLEKNSRRMNILSVLLGGIASIIGLITFAQYAAGVSYGIDELLVRDFPNTESFLHPGRMSPNSALLFFLLGFSPLFTLASTRHQKVLETAVFLPLLSISATALIGYLFKEEFFYQVGPFIRMSWQAAASFTLIIIGFLFVRPQHGPLKVLVSPDYGGITARSLLPLVIVIPVFLGWLRLQGQYYGFFNLELGLSIHIILQMAILVAVVVHTAKRLDTIEKRRNTAQVDFETLANSMDQLAWLSDSEGNVYWYNQRWYDYTGKTFEELKGWGWQQVHPPETVEEVTQRFKEVIQSRQGGGATFPIIGKNGERRWFLTLVSPIKDSDGQVLRWLGTHTDVTFQRDAEKALESALKSRDDFLSIVSHELKTPLTSLKLLVDIFKRKSKIQETQVYSRRNVNEMIDDVEKQVSRVMRLVDDMLDVARIRTGNLVIEPEKIDLCEVVKDVLKRMEPQFTAAAVPAPKIEACERAVGHWDRFRIEQVVNNLLTNAIRYGDGKPVSVRVESLPTDVKLYVIDQGIGVAKENQDKIFDRFERAVDSSEVSGLGLGLFITKQIVKAHGGEVWVDSELGVGSEFCVRLPKTRESIERAHS